MVGQIQVNKRAIPTRDYDKRAARPAYFSLMSLDLIIKKDVERLLSADACQSVDFFVQTFTDGSVCEERSYIQRRVVAKC